jgi:hypothetical protein
MLCSCNSAQNTAVEACEIFIKERLRSPSTYQRITSDGLGPSFESDGRRVKMITIEYDAANAYGTPIRGSQQCTFKVDGKGNFVDDPKHAARMASIGADTDYAPCCTLDEDGTSASLSVDNLEAEAINATDSALNAASGLQE